MDKLFDKFKVFDLIIIAMMAALGIATKPIIVPLTHIITGPLYIPGGSIAGGFYMMWIILGAGLVGKRWTAALIALVQAVMVISTGVYGTHGLASIVTYTLPGLAVDILFLLIRHRGCCFGCLFFAGMAANLTGTVLSNLVFFRLPLIPLVLSLGGGALSGGLGGIIAYTLVKQFKKFNIQ